MNKIGRKLAHLQSAKCTKATSRSKVAGRIGGALPANIDVVTPLADRITALFPQTPNGTRSIPGYYVLKRPQMDEWTRRVYGYENYRTTYDVSLSSNYMLVETKTSPHKKTYSIRR